MRLHRFLGSKITYFIHLLKHPLFFFCCSSLFSSAAAGHYSAASLTPHSPSEAKSGYPYFGQLSSMEAGLCGRIHWYLINYLSNQNPVKNFYRTLCFKFDLPVVFFSPDIFRIRKKKSFKMKNATFDETHVPHKKKDNHFIKIKKCCTLLFFFYVVYYKKVMKSL